MNKRKWILFWAIVVTVAIALSLSCGYLRFLLIQLTYRADLPAWLKMIIWGWI